MVSLTFHILVVLVYLTHWSLSCHFLYLISKYQLVLWSHYSWSRSRVEVAGGSRSVRESARCFGVAGREPVVIEVCRSLL